METSDQPIFGHGIRGSHSFHVHNLVQGQCTNFSFTLLYLRRHLQLVQGQQKRFDVFIPT